MGDSPIQPEHARARWALPWRVLAGIALLTIAAYWQAPTLGWTGWDDTAYVVNNPHMSEPGGLWRIWTTNESEQYYPLSFTFYWMQHRVFGGSPAGYHAVSVLLHLANILLGVLALRAVGASRWVACVSGAVFALHPTQVMSVAWIAEQKNLLATGFMLACVLAWTRSAGGTRWRVVALVLYVLAMLSKTVVIGLPVSLLVLDRVVAGRTWAAGVKRVAPMLVAGVLLAALTLAFETKFVDSQAEAFVPPLVERLQIAGAAPWAYLARLAWPVGLSPAYELWGVSRASVGWYLPLAASALAGLAAVWVVARRPAWGFPAWCVIHAALMIGPTLGVVAFGNLAVTDTSDHFLYPALLTVFAAVAHGLERFLDRAGAWEWPVRAGVVAAVIACGVGTVRYLPVFHDAESMWTRGAKVAPTNYTAHLALAEGLRANGKSEEALREYAVAVGLRPGWVDAYLFLGDAQRDAGRRGEAEATYRKGLEVSPGNAVVMTRLAELLESRRALDEAQGLFERAVRADPAHVPARMGLAQMHLGYARFDDALAQFEAIVRARPGHARAHLGVVTCLVRLGRTDDARRAVDRAIAAAPRDAALWNMSARLYLGSSEARASERALRDATRSAELAPGDFRVLATLAEAQAASGDRAGAAATAARAAKAARSEGDVPAATALEHMARDLAGGG